MGGGSRHTNTHTTNPPSPCVCVDCHHVCIIPIARHVRKTHTHLLLGIVFLPPEHIHMVITALFMFCFHFIVFPMCVFHYNFIARHVHLCVSLLRFRYTLCILCVHFYGMMSFFHYIQTAAGTSRVKIWAQHVQCTMIFRC
ncbi:uncharacterized protein TM35_000301720 [Trypanosoma theileri]|uniref:Uncharacterized protein n=1 Tax=Trypanosoma theileri TaxID=67003 RepID=A0A1X0NN28_9TRYP|nr:uncharacterized protein TM35_000301720 [Trypanosoma theileri]ORC86132.1 hypothetical protein TM35_000301720 [Trypanosoma theileri]